MQNGSSLVTWVENVDVREKEDDVHAILKPFVESSFAFRTSRWIATLQRQVKRFIYSKGINISPSDASVFTRRKKKPYIDGKQDSVDVIRSDQEVPLMPFGFSILPNISGSILDGTLLTMVFQITVKNVSSKQAVEVVNQIVKETLQRIIEAVN
ncbi:hypothetical protein M0R45_019847 [Rubus argutus]|uniref:START domain-containing protein n=1 Tax=Rubus argutus TaxID=59490 RepID=A0AAW1X8K6_RUBAR